MTARLAFVFALLATASGMLHAGPRTSANYTILTDTIDAGGKRAVSASYTNDGSLGAVAAFPPSPRLRRRSRADMPRNFTM